MNEQRSLQTLITVLPVASAGLYLLGLSYHQGYLAAYGLEESLFPLQADRVLFNGFLAFVTVSLPGAVYGLGALALLLSSVALAIGLSGHPQIRGAVTRLARRIATLIGKHNSSSKAFDVLDRGGTLYVLAAAAALIPVALVLMAALAAEQGATQARREMKDFQSGSGPRAQVTIDAQSQAMLGRLIACSERHCAYWTGAQTIVLRHDSVHRVAATPASRIAASAGVPPAPRPASAP